MSGLGADVINHTYHILNRTKKKSGKIEVFFSFVKLSSAKLRFNAVTETRSPHYIREVKIQFPDNLFNLASTLGEKLWSSFFLA